MDLNAQLAQLLGSQGGPGQMGGGPIVEFKAGKMVQEGTTVRPDTRKGKVTLARDDGVLKLEWQERQSETAEDSAIVVPGDASVELVPECNTGRVFLFRFQSDPARKWFFWLQEGKEEKDAELLQKLNDAFKETQDQARQ